ncbi:hypothetical protein IM774_00120 [Erysipelotrichaceae bacterium RD49]|nr:hypothetical protein [Erysipelotrichaceae bacterium RD49]
MARQIEAGLHRLWPGSKTIFTVSSLLAVFLVFFRFLRFENRKIFYIKKPPVLQAAKQEVSSGFKGV